MTDPAKILLPEEILDTRALQLTSLTSFAEELGFYQNYLFGNASQFFSDNKGLETVSLSTMVNLHNKGAIQGHYWDLQGCHRTDSPFKLDEYVWTRANAAKIVNHVFLQASKKTGEITCHKHIVSFVKPSYERIFLEDCKSLGLKSITDTDVFEMILKS